MQCRAVWGFARLRHRCNLMSAPMSSTLCRSSHRSLRRCFGSNALPAKQTSAMVATEAAAVQSLRRGERRCTDWPLGHDAPQCCPPAQRRLGAEIHCHRLVTCPRPKRKRSPLFAGDSSNVGMALTQNAQAETRLFKSGSKHLICLLDSAAGAGFEPAAFRL